MDSLSLCLYIYIYACVCVYIYSQYSTYTAADRSKNSTYAAVFARVFLQICVGVLVSIPGMVHLSTLSQWICHAST